MWDNFENLTKVLAKLCVLLLIHTFLEILPAYSLKSPNLFNFREGNQKGRGANRGALFSAGGRQQETLRHCPVVNSVLLYVVMRYY